MTKQELETQIRTIIYDNPDGDVSAGDVGDVLMTLYDTVILNSGAGGSLPINMSDVTNLDANLDVINANINHVLTIVGWTSYETSPYQHIKTQVPLFIAEELQIQGSAPYIDFTSEAGSVEDGSIRFKDVTGDVTARIAYDKSNGHLQLQHITNNTVDSMLILSEQGHISVLDVDPINDENLVTFGAYKRLEQNTNTVTGSIISDKITKDECVSVMISEGYPFDTDVNFIVIDGNKKATVEYFANGDTDQSGTAYAFMTMNTEKAVI